MGLFDAFGVGGGELQIQLQYPQTQAGGVLTGAVVYAAGKRSQKITAITVKLTCSLQVKAPQGVQQQSTDVCPTTMLSAAFATQPGQHYQFPFQLQLPPQAYQSQPGQVSYRLSASADIDGEVDPGAGVDIQVMGQPYQPAMQQGYDPGYGQGQGYDPGYDKNVVAKKMAADPYAQQGGYDQGQGYDPGYDKGVVAKKMAADPYAQQKGGYDQGQGYGKPVDPYAQGKGGHGFAPGSDCLAQWSDGGYYGATVVEQQGNMVMVQWDDGSAASWVQDNQLSPG